MMFVLLIAVYTVQELSTDQFHENKDRIYIVGSEEDAATGAAIAYKIKDRYPEVEKVCPVVSSGEKFVVKVGDQKWRGEFLFADSTFFDLFSFPLVEGDRSQALSALNYAVVSESFAKKLFGAEDPLGKTFTVADSLSLVVSGVMRDMERTSFHPADVILRWQLVKYWNFSLAPDQLSNAAGTMAFVLAREGTDFTSRAEDMRDWFKTFFWIYQRGIWNEVRIEPLEDFYFSGWNSRYMLQTGDWDFVLLLLSIGILILVFAVINYVNLTVAQAGFRAKEMATRRLLGSLRGEIFLRLMAETTLLTFISLLIGILLAYFLCPHVNDLLQTQLDMSVLFAPAWITALLALTLVVGAISGLLPAIVISSAKPIEVVRGTLCTRTKMTFSKGFIIFQNVITITMVAVSIVMISQIRYMLNAPLGYRTNNLLVVDLTMLTGNTEGLANELRGLPGVRQVGKVAGLPLFGSNNWTTTYQGNNISFQQFRMDKESFGMLGLEIVRDNHLASDGWFLSEQAMREMNLPEDATSVQLEESTIPIAGIIRDFYCLGNVLAGKSPVMLRLNEKTDPWAFLVETQGDPVLAKKEVEETFAKVIGLDGETQFMDEALQRSFESQIRMAKIVSVFSVIAILISLLGLLAMSIYFIQQRVLEISIRKVYGSSDRQILTRLVLTFLSYVLVAFVIAIPIIIYFMRDWLSDYSYRISLHPLYFVAAGVFCLLTSFGTVFFQCYRASISNPADNFRNQF